MSSVDVDHAELREELPNQGYDLVRHVGTSRSPYEQGRLLKPDLTRVLERKVAKVVEGPTQDAERDAKLASTVARATAEIGEEELSYGERLPARCQQSRFQDATAGDTLLHLHSPREFCQPQPES